jgi:hypothetical protein
MYSEAELLALSQKLLGIIVSKRDRVKTKYAYYEAEQRMRDLGISMPARLLALQSGLGWASKAVDVMADRLSFDAFENDRLGINDLYEIADETEAVDQAKHDMFIAGCSFIAITDDDQIFEKRFVPFSALEATGVLNVTTGLLRYGLTITQYNRDQSLADKYSTNSINYAEDWILFAEGYTAIFEKRRLVRVVPNNTGRNLLYLLANRPTTKEPFGRSIISREARLLIQSGLRTMNRAEVAGEFYSAPQRYLLGVSEDFEKDESMDLTLGKIAVIESDDEGKAPTAGQWQQQSMTPYAGQLQMIAQQFCAKTSLTLHSLGFDTSNPTSAESYEAQNEDLRLVVEKTGKHLGVVLKKLAIGLRLAKSDTSLITPEMRAIVPHWHPVFKVDIGPAGDAFNKVLQTVPELKGSVRMYYMLGMNVAEATKYADAANKTDIANAMGGGAGA